MEVVAGLDATTVGVATLSTKTVIFMSDDVSFTPIALGNWAANRYTAEPNKSGIVRHCHGRPHYSHLPVKLYDNVTVWFAGTSSVSSL